MKGSRAILAKGSAAKNFMVRSTGGVRVKEAGTPAVQHGPNTKLSDLLADNGDDFLSTSIINQPPRSHVKEEQTAQTTSFRSTVVGCAADGDVPEMALIKTGNYLRVNGAVMFDIEKDALDLELRLLDPNYLTFGDTHYRIDEKCLGGFYSVTLECEGDFTSYRAHLALNEETQVYMLEPYEKGKDSYQKLKFNSLFKGIASSSSATVILWVDMTLKIIPLS